MVLIILVIIIIIKIIIIIIIIEKEKEKKKKRRRREEKKKKKKGGFINNNWRLSLTNNSLHIFEQDGIIFISSNVCMYDHHLCKFSVRLTADLFRASTFSTYRTE